MQNDETFVFYSIHESVIFSINVTNIVFILNQKLLGLLFIKNWLSKVMLAISDLFALVSSTNFFSTWCTLKGHTYLNKPAGRRCRSV